MFRWHSCSGYIGELLKGPKTTISLLALLHNQIHRFGSKTQKDLRHSGRTHRIYGSHRWLVPSGESPESGELAQSIKVRMSHRVKEANRGPPCLAVMMGRWKRRIWEPSHSLSVPVQERSWWVHPECHGSIVCFSFSFLFLPGKNKMADSVLHTQCLLYSAVSLKIWQQTQKIIIIMLFGGKISLKGFANAERHIRGSIRKRQTKLEVKNIYTTV